jgi:hypothetical protein
VGEYGRAAVDTENIPLKPLQVGGCGHLPYDGQRALCTPSQYLIARLFCRQHYFQTVDGTGGILNVQLVDDARNCFWALVGRASDLGDGEDLFRCFALGGADLLETVEVGHGSVRGEERAPEGLSTEVRDDPVGAHSLERRLGRDVIAHLEVSVEAFHRPVLLLGTPE